MAFETAGKSVNPFLMEDVPDYNEEPSGGSFNPFLSNTEYTVPETSDNPFLNNAEADPSPFNSSSTNPFADFSYDSTAPTNIFGTDETQNSTDYTNIFSSEPSPQNDFFAMEPVKPEPPPSLNLMEEQNDYCNETSQIFGVEEPTLPAPPKRPPPPPRPNLPPSKETVDLILSVTGAMDATSSHLLDRLQATRTPSPTPIRDLHTPSPTPDSHFGDLLETGDSRLTPFPEHSDVNLLGDDPIIPTGPPAIPPSHPGAAPAHPPGPPPRPGPPPGPPPRPQRPPEPQHDDMFDMFGTSHPPVPTVPTSNADILGLFNAPLQTKPQQNADLLSDDFIMEPQTITTTQENNASVTNQPTNEFVSLSEGFALDNYSEINDNIVKSESFTTEAQIPKPDSFPEELKEAVIETSSSIPDIVKPIIPESFVTNIPETFKTELSDDFGTGIPDNYTPVSENYGSMHDTFGRTIDDGFNAEQPDTYPAVTESFSTTISDTFGSMNNDYNAVNDNFGATIDSGFGSNQHDTFPAVSETFSTISDTFPPAVSETYSSVPDFGTGINDAYGAIGDNFGSGISDTFGMPDNTAPIVADTFGSTFGTSIQETFGSAIDAFGSQPAQNGSFDDFASKFDNIASREDGQGTLVAAAEDPFDPFGSAAAPDTSGGDAWGASAAGGEVSGGFGADESFDAFLSMNEPPPVPAIPPSRVKRHESNDSDEGQKNFSVLIRPRNIDGEMPPTSLGPLTALAPPPKSPQNNNTAFTDTSPRFNPFDKSLELSQPLPPQGEPEGALERTDSQETPPTPLFDEDVSQPLEDFPRVLYTGEGWEMHLRQPNKKKITGQRFWKKVFVKLVHQGDSPVLQLYNTKDDKDPFQELPLQACYSVSDIGAQQFDNFGKIFTVKLQYVFYKERPGVRPGQVTKAERITTKLSQFAAYAIQGDYQGCKEFGSDLKKLGLPVEHAPQISQLFKLGCASFEDLKSFSVQVEESLFRLAVHRDRALNYKTEEVQITAVDELYVEQDCYGHVEKQIARVRLFFLGFLAGMPDVELGVNDMWRQGKEVVGRHDIIPVVTEEWIRLENVEFHTCVQLDEYERTHVIKFKPPDACYLELMRFRIRPPKNRELPLQVKTVMCVTGNKVQLNCDILVPGFSSRKLGQIPCEDIMVRFPIPECWIYLFRVEKHFRYGSVKSTHRRTGKVKGIERFLGTMETLDQSLIEVTSGQAKYEHQHRAIVWRMSRLPKEGQGAYTTHNLVCRMGLTSFDQIPDKLADYCYVEFTMPATQASHMTVRSVSLSNQAKDDPPEKYVRQLARHEYRVGIEHTQGEGPGAYVSATIAKPAAPAPPPVVDQLDQPEPIAESDSDSSN